MSKTWLITPCFGKAALLHDSLEHLAKTPHGVEHLIVDSKYPVDQAHNSSDIKLYSQAFKCTYLDAGYDRGLHENLNFAVETAGVGPDDILIGSDCDARPTPGFVQAITEVMLADPMIACCALNFWVIDERFGQGKLTESEIAGHRVWNHPGVEMFDVTGFNMKFIHEIGGFKQFNKYYGLLESYLHSKWAPKGMKLVYLRDYRCDAAPVDRENPLLFDKSYRTWKSAHVGGDPRSFGEWLTP